MKTTLTIDTSSTLCSIGLFHNNQLFEKKQAGFKSHASVILSFIDELLIQSKQIVKFSNIDLEEMINKYKDLVDKRKKELYL